jgi:hypothetical protein
LHLQEGQAGGRVSKANQMRPRRWQRICLNINWKKVWAKSLPIYASLTLKIRGMKSVIGPDMSTAMRINFYFLGGKVIIIEA